VRAWAGHIGLELGDLRLTPEDSEVARVRVVRPHVHLAQLPPEEIPVANPLETDGSTVAQDDQEGATQVGALPDGGNFSDMTIAELLQLDLVLPAGPDGGEPVEQADSSTTEVVDLTELSLLELMNLKAKAAAQPDLPDLAPTDVKLQLNDGDLDQSPPSHLSPEGGLTPIGVLPDTSSQPLPPPPPPPPSPDINVAPNANNDVYTVLEDGVLVRNSANGVLHNDSDANSDPLSVTLISGPANGTLSLSANGAFIYHPNPNFNGTDSFTYESSDGRGGTDTAVVTIVVNPVNDPPVASNDAYSTSEDAALIVSAGTGALVNDSDVDGNPLTTTLLSGTTHGSVILNADGSFTYVPNADFNGTDSFTYRAVDTRGAVSNTGIVTISVAAVNDAPVAFNDGATVAEDATLIGTSVLANDSDAHKGRSRRKQHALDRSARQYRQQRRSGLQRRRHLHLYPRRRLQRHRQLHLPGRRCPRRCLQHGHRHHLGELGQRRPRRLQ